MRWAILLVLGVLLAGCADAPPVPAPVNPLPPSARYDFPDGGAHEESIASAAFALTPSSPELRVPVTVRNGTLQVRVNLTFHDGAGAGFSLRLAGCAFDAQAVAATSPDVSVDCGMLQPGAHELVLAHTSGALSGGVEVVARVCDDLRGGCPTAPP